ncbi:hypothetical protein ACPV5Q_14125 [Vibrio astriarenae]
METSIVIGPAAIDRINSTISSKKSSTCSQSQTLSFIIEPQLNRITVIIGPPDSIERLNFDYDGIKLRKPIDFSMTYEYWRNALSLNSQSSLTLILTTKNHKIKYDIADVPPILNRTANPAMEHHRQALTASQPNDFNHTSVTLFSLLLKEINDLDPYGFVEVDADRQMFLVEMPSNVEEQPIPAHCKWNHNFTLHKECLPSLKNMQLGNPKHGIHLAQHDCELHLQSGNHSLTLSLRDRESFDAKPISGLKAELHFSCQANTLHSSLKGIKRALPGLQTVYWYFQGRDITLTLETQNDDWVYPIDGELSQRVDRKAYSLNLAELISVIPNKAGDLHFEVVKNVKGEHSMKVYTGTKNQFVNMICQNQAIPELAKKLQALKAKNKENQKRKKNPPGGAQMTFDF